MPAKKKTKPEKAQAKRQAQPEALPDFSAASPVQSSAVSWTASEFVVHEKGDSWYAMLGLSAAVTGALVYLLTREFFSPLMVVIVIIALGVFASRKPRVLKYNLDESGLTIADKFYGYENFKSFALMQEGPVQSLTFLPLKRFMPDVTAYFPPEQEEGIMNILSNQLPQEQRELDMIDRLMRRIRF